MLSLTPFVKTAADFHHAAAGGGPPCCDLRN
jgi:hypothetical protein